MDTGLGIKGLVIKGREILVLRKPNGELDLPGGRVERGESPEETLEREIFEEIGRVRVRILAPVATWSFVKNSGLLVKGQTWACACLGGSIRLSGEHAGFIWLNGFHPRALNLFSCFGLANFGIWAGPGPCRMAGSSLQEHFQEFRLKGVAGFAGTNR